MFHYNLFVFTEVSPMQEIKTFQSEEFWKPRIVFRIWWVGLKCDFFFFSQVILISMLYWMSCSTISLEVGFCNTCFTFYFSYKLLSKYCPGVEFSYELKASVF